MKEEAPVNAAGGGAIAGMGVGPDGEPPASRKKKDASKESTKALRKMWSFKDYLVKGQK